MKQERGLRPGFFYRVANAYFSKWTLPHWVILLMDLFIIAFVSYAIYWYGNGYIALRANLKPLTATIALELTVFLILFRIFRTYRGIVRHSSFQDLHKILLVFLWALLVFFALDLLWRFVPCKFFIHLRFSFFVAVEITSCGLMCLYRIVVKLIFDTYFRTGNAKNVMIYGIRYGGVGLAEVISSEKPKRFQLRGFISHDTSLSAQGTYLFGKPIFDVNPQLPQILRDRNIDAVLVAHNRIERFREDSELQDYILNAGVKIFMSHFTEGVADEASALREVSIDDLLPRDEVMIDMKAIREAFQGKKVLITGSAGSIGSEIVRQVAELDPSEMMLIDQAETPQHDIRLMMMSRYPEISCTTVVASVTEPEQMEKIFRDFQPVVVLHAAAYKHVPMMEDNPCESIRNNVYGTKVVADLAVKYGVKKFVMISTDKAVNPTSVMGCSKRLCEIYVQSLNEAQTANLVPGHTQFVTTRFGNVLGSNGSVIPIFKKQIEAGGPVTVTDPNIVRYFMLISEACKLVLEACVKGQGGEIYVFDMGKPVRIADLARRMIRLAGATNVKIEYTGLRKGEKLYEEVLNDAETTLTTENEMIYVAKARHYSYDDVNRDIQDLIALARTFDDMAVVAKMKEMVPEYVSNNSPYSVLDRVENK
jgi:FlaA1/EpsC-like NDP-sugar epimerase